MASFNWEPCTLDELLQVLDECGIKRDEKHPLKDVDPAFFRDIMKSYGLTEKQIEADTGINRSTLNRNINHPKESPMSTKNACTLFGYFDAAVHDADCTDSDPGIYEYRFPMEIRHRLAAYVTSEAFTSCLNYGLFKRNRCAKLLELAFDCLDARQIKTLSEIAANMICSNESRGVVNSAIHEQAHSLALEVLDDAEPTADQQAEILSGELIEMLSLKASPNNS